MPFFVTEANIKVRLTGLMQPGEEVVAYLHIGAFKRTILALTSQNRFLHASYPYFAKSAVLSEFPLAAVSGCDYTVSGNFTRLHLRTDRGEQVYPIANTSFTPVTEQLSLLLTHLFKHNQAARPGYMGADESILATMSTKQGVIRLTERHLFKMDQGKRVPIETTDLATLKQLDCYPGSWDSQLLVLQLQDGTPRLYKMGMAGEMASVMLVRDVDGLVSLLFKGLAQCDPTPRPEYLEPGEDVLGTAQCAHTQVGLLKPGTIIRLTSTRLLELEPTDSGLLRVTRAIRRSDIGGGHLVKHISRNIDYELGVRLSNGEQITLWLTAKWDRFITTIRNELRLS